MHSKQRPASRLLLAGLVATTLAVAGCNHTGDDLPSYMVTLTNATHGQVIAPITVLLHGDGYAAWTVGSPAGDGLERLAEGGDPATLVTEAAAAGADTAALGATLAPGASALVTVEASRKGHSRMTVAGMLVATNDGFAGLGGIDLGGLARGASATYAVPVFDAGTEANSETAASVPGLGGTGYDAARDDRADQVTGHPGVVTADDGLATSGLDAGHRFDNPALLVTVSRL